LNVAVALPDAVARAEPGWEVNTSIGTGWKYEPFTPGSIPEPELRRDVRRRESPAARAGRAPFEQVGREEAQVGVDLRRGDL
jgi:hypothetical protein